LINCNAAENDWNQFETELEKGYGHDVNEALQPLLGVTFLTLENFDDAIGTHLVPRDKRDINQSLYDERNDIISQVANIALRKHDQNLLAAEVKKSKYTIERDGWLLVLVENKEQACKYGKDTAWCIAASIAANRFDEYRYSRGWTIYVVIDPNGRKFIILVDENDDGTRDEDEIQVWDASNKRLYPSKLDAFPFDRSEYKPIAPPLEKRKEWILNNENKTLADLIANIDFAIYVMKERWPEIEGKIERAFHHLQMVPKGFNSRLGKAVSSYVKEFGLKWNLSSESVIARKMKTLDDE